MQVRSRLYVALYELLRDFRHWLDKRHLVTLVWMVVGLLQSERVSLTSWVPYVESRATYAQSSQRRFQRWLSNERIEVNRLYGPLIQHALGEWGTQTLYLALDTSRLFEDYCLIRVSVVYRGRAVPVVWKVLEHASSTVSYEAYAELLQEAAKLLPSGIKVVLLADRGFADTALMKLAKKLGWHFRIRIKCSFAMYRHGRRYKVNQLGLQPGQALYLNHVLLTDQRYGPVYLALAHHSSNAEQWYIVSDEPVGPATFRDYGFRFDIEENFLDDKSNGFQLESSLLRGAKVLERLCMVLAVSTLYLVSQGTQVVQEGKRRWVDPHWFRGSSYLKIGWRWVITALCKGWHLCCQLALVGGEDPDPSRASRRHPNSVAVPEFQVMAWDALPC